MLGSDPVSLAIRTGLSFKLVLRLGSQAVVRRHLGMWATALVPIGLADAEPIATLVEKYAEKQGKQAAVLTDDKVVANAVNLINNAFVTKPTTQKTNAPASIVAESLAKAFERIAAESYTKFLLATDNANDSEDAGDQNLAVAKQTTNLRIEAFVRITQPETEDA